MSELFAVFKHYLLWSLLVWVIVFVAFTAAFARGRLSAFANGLFRIFVAVIVSPFVYISKAVGAVLAFDRGQEDAYRASDQYLLNKAMLVLQAIVIVSAIGALSAAIIATWHAWVPPSEVRDAAREYGPKVDEQRTRAQNAAAEVTRLDAEWTSKQAEVFAKYRRDRQRTVNDSSATMASIEKNLATYDATALAVLQQIKAAAGQRSSGTSDGIESAKRYLDSIVNANWWGPSPWGRENLEGWNNHWRIRQYAAMQLSNVPVDELRAEAQPDYSSVRSGSEVAASTLTAMEEDLKSRREAASLKWKAAAWTALASLFTILLYVWIIGIIVEAAWLAIRIAGDVRALREVAERRAPVSDDRSYAGPPLQIRDATAAPLSA